MLASCSCGARIDAVGAVLDMAVGDVAGVGAVGQFPGMAGLTGCSRPTSRPKTERENHLHKKMSLLTAFMAATPASARQCHSQYMRCLLTKRSWSVESDAANFAYSPPASG